jgi:hypothetical protein
MNCKQSHDQLMRYFDHNIKNKEWELLNQHLNSCKSCFDLFNHLQGILDALETAQPVEPPPGLEKLTLQRIRSLPASQPNGQYEFTKLIYASVSIVALSLVLVIGLSLKNANLFDLILLGRHLTYSFSGIVINVQIIYEVVSGFFATTLFSIFRQIEFVYMAAIPVTFFLAIKTVFAKLVNHKTGSI